MTFLLRRKRPTTVPARNIPNPTAFSLACLLLFAGGSLALAQQNRSAASGAEPVFRASSNPLNSQSPASARGTPAYPDIDAPPIPNIEPPPAPQIDVPSIPKVDAVPAPKLIGADKTEVKKAPAVIGAKVEKTTLAPMYSTSHKVVSEMLKLAGVKQGDVVCDLGCGDGRFVVKAVKEFKALAGFGIDPDKELIARAMENAAMAGVEKSVKFFHGNAVNVPGLSNVNVVTLDLHPEINRRLAPMVIQVLKPGSRLISHNAELADRKAEKRIEVVDEQGVLHVLCLWIVPNRDDALTTQATKPSARPIAEMAKSLPPSLTPVRALQEPMQRPINSADAIIAEFAKLLEPPSPSLLFDHRDSQKMLEERMRQQALQRVPPDTVEFPKNDPISKSTYVARVSPPKAMYREPHFVVYNRLFMEEKNAERYGWDLGFMQCAVSTLYFYRDVALWPHNFWSHPLRPYETNVGLPLPGDPVPYIIYPPEFTLTGSVAETALLVGLFAIFP